MAVVIIGNPNVGKSAVINRLIGSKIIVSNYPGTSIEVQKLKSSIGEQEVVIYDTPGVYSLLSDGVQQRAIKDILKQENVELILNIVDVTNLGRNLLLTYELLELDIPMVVVINQVDRARLMGIDIDKNKLSSLLHCRVVSFSAATGEGLVSLIKLLENRKLWVKKYRDEEFPERILLTEKCEGNCFKCSSASENCLAEAELKRAEKARLTANLVTNVGQSRRVWMDKAQSLLDRPVLGSLILLFIAYLGFIALLKFIHFSEGPISAVLEPVSIYIESIIAGRLPPGMINTILSKAIPEGLIIPFTIIMPAMLIVSFLMSILEDTGLLPRYSVAMERVGRMFGVSGQAVIPLSLGFGCRTPAILATRIMPTYSERFVVITLLSIIVPCAATMGVMAAVISAFHAYLEVVVLTMIAVLMLMGFIISRRMPREEAFVYELPPLRIPLWSNVWNKVKLRFSGFFTEVLPLLLVMNIALRALIESGLFHIFSPLDGWSRMIFGIPVEAFAAVLITIFQRYLAPLVLLNLALTPREATIAITMIALSLPCLPVMVMTVREIGFKGLVKILITGFTVSMLVGVFLNLVMPG